ncbi:MAG: hypothetical protein V1899_05030 [Planctomycetota bacterium]
MTDDQFPMVGVPEVDAGHAADEASGFGDEVRRQLEALGFIEPRHIASGYKARVYAAHAPSGEKVAIRVQASFALSRPRERPTLRNYLLMKLLVALLPTHPNLIRYYSSGALRVHDATGTRTKVFYQVMPYVEGMTLLAALNDPTYRAGGLERLRGTIMGILDGWTAIHRRGLRQGDIYPGNILLERDTWNPVLIDLRFSLRFGRTLVHEHRKFRATLRSVLTGFWENSKIFEPLNANAAIVYWQSHNPETRQQLQEWLDFEATLAEGCARFHIAPPRLLAAAREIACRQI